jgi:hypothetical protein
MELDARTQVLFCSLEARFLSSAGLPGSMVRAFDAQVVCRISSLMTELFMLTARRMFFILNFSLLCW